MKTTMFRFGLRSLFLVVASGAIVLALILRYWDAKQQRSSVSFLIAGGARVTFADGVSPKPLGIFDTGYASRVTELEVHRYGLIDDPNMLAKFQSLQKLHLDHNRVNGKHLANMKHLTSLTADDASLSPRDVGRVTTLTDLQVAEPWDDLSELNQLVELQYLRLKFARVADLAPLSAIKSLRGVRISYNSVPIKDIDPLTSLPNLTWLKLEATALGDLSPLSRLRGLEGLSLAGSSRVENLEPVAQLSHLTRLNVSRTQVTELRPVSRLSALRALEISHTRVTDLQPLSELTQLEELGLQSTKVVDLRPISRLTNLEWLDLHDTAVSDIEPISGLQRLRWLSLWRTKISDLTPLQKLTNLEELVLDSGTQSLDLRPLAGMSRLKINDRAVTDFPDLRFPRRRR